jgi:uncharacterized repeat protein (TIGR01451 family)
MVISRGFVYRSAVVVVLVVVACVLWVAGARAAVPAAAWRIEGQATPSVFSPGASVQYMLTATNVGSLPMDGSTITLKDSLPPGLEAQSVSFRWTGFPVNQEDLSDEYDLGRFFCSVSTVECQFPTAAFGLPAVALGDKLRMIVTATVAPGAPSALSIAGTVSGGGPGEASVSEQVPVGTNPVLFGVAGFSNYLAGLDGAPETQAGGHAYELTTTIVPTTVFKKRFPGNITEPAQSARDMRDVVVDLPLGLAGSALSAPACPLALLSAAGGHGQKISPSGCSPDTVVGHLTTLPFRGFDRLSVPVFHMVSERGVVAEYGYRDGLRSPHLVYAGVALTPAGYVLRVTAREIPQVALSNILVNFYGNPAEHDHSGGSPIPSFTNPADCSGEPLRTTIHMDSWRDPGRYNADGTPDFSDPNWASAVFTAPPVTGCNLLRFDPSLVVQPETAQADSPSGVGVDLRVPQSENFSTLGTPPLRDASVTLPEGLTVNPSAADGLGVCTEAEVALGSAAPPGCPQDSKIGSVEVEAPGLPGVLEGSVYLAAQNENPFHSLFAGYIVIDDPVTGVVLKVPGDLTPNPATGQITGVFKDSPQFSFSDLRLHFFGGPRAPLATPMGCGTYTTTSDLMPWSAPDSGPDATPSSSFQIESGCVSGFAPSFTAGSLNPQAGAYAPFTLSISRTDGEQNLAGVSVTLPPGSLGKIAGIALCPDAQANAGTCPESSRVGSASAGAGVGPNPYFVSGKVYLTGSYKGGPYGLVEEVPAVAGPFDLGVVVVRQSLRVDPHTAQVSAVSDPLPTILDGIPLRVRRVDVTLDRPGFTFNPTNCTPMQVMGTLTSTQGASASVASRFQMGGCGELPFHPVFSVSTQAKTSKANGASLIVKSTFPSGPQANIKSVAVVLPKQLPARLTTIQQACPEAAFAANPASCPAGSNIGVATATTPVLATPLTGPAYLVSHGGAAFPDVVIVFQDEGVTLDLVGSVNIKHGITSSTFATVPDAPISGFQLSLPEGPHSGLAAVVPAKAKGNLCGQSLSMPFTITGQNGAVLKQNVKIAVTGCGKAKAKRPSRRRKAKK